MTCVGIDTALTPPLVAIDHAMSPYRTIAIHGQRKHAWFDDDRVLGVALLLIGALRVVLTFAEHDAFANEFTIALLMVAAALHLIFRRRR